MYNYDKLDILYIDVSCNIGCHVIYIICKDPYEIALCKGNSTISYRRSRLLRLIKQLIQ